MIPIGAAVRDVATGRLGRIVRVPRAVVCRGYCTVKFDTEPTWRLIRETALRYVARHYSAAIAWDAHAAETTTTRRPT